MGVISEEYGTCMCEVLKIEFYVRIVVILVNSLLNEMDKLVKVYHLTFAVISATAEISFSSPT